MRQFDDSPGTHGEHFGPQAEQSVPKLQPSVGVRRVNGPHVRKSKNRAQRVAPMRLRIEPGRHRA